MALVASQKKASLWRVGQDTLASNRCNSAVVTSKTRCYVRNRLCLESNLRVKALLIRAALFHYPHIVLYQRHAIRKLFLCVKDLVASSVGRRDTGVMCAYNVCIPTGTARDQGL